MVSDSIARAIQKRIEHYILAKDVQRLFTYCGCFTVRITRKTEFLILTIDHHEFSKKQKTEFPKNEQGLGRCMM